jgi:RND family efflux transporter MFP subunit
MMRNQWLLRIATGAALIGIGASVTFLIMNRREHETIKAEPPSGSKTASDERSDFEFSLNEDSLGRAGIETATVAAGPMTAEVRAPGVIEPNAYRTVTVTPLVSGRILAVPAELGDHVQRGQTLATVFSPDLADAQSRYLSMKAELEVGRERLKRTERLAEIGAASRQELEEERAIHTRHETEVEEARARLLLLGIAADEADELASPGQMSANATVPAPVSGVVIQRLANPGLVVDTATQLFTVSDLSSVWVMGAVYERDFRSIAVGSPAVLTTSAYPGVELEGRVGYIDPRVNDETRTAQVRVEVENPEGRLRLGMYVDLRISSPEQAGAIVVARTAIQLLGERSVVYLVIPGATARFVEREVTLGRRIDDQMEVLGGLKPGDVVVTSGSFYVRAERERSFPRSEGSPSPPGGHPH